MMSSRTSAGNRSCNDFHSVRSRHLKLVITGLNDMKELTVHEAETDLEYVVVMKRRPEENKD